MTLYLPDELLLEVAQHVVSQSALAALCQVSKRFYHLFSPFLYRDFWIDDNPEILSRIPDSHFCSVQSLTLGEFCTHNVRLSEAEFFLCLNKMNNLRSLEIPAALIEGFLTSGSDEQLQSFRGIQDITLRGPWLKGDNPDWKMPHFRDLRKLHLLDIDVYFSSRNCRELSKVMLSSPELRDLALMMYEYTFISDPIAYRLGLIHTIKHYNTQRVKRRLPRLRLSHLLLGPGFMPYHGFHILSDGSDYLSMLTELSALRTLKLLNYTGSDYYFDEDFCPGVEAEAFEEATSLRCLSVVALTPDIERLLDFPAIAKNLTELTILIPFRKPDSGNIQRYLSNPDFPWKRISLYCWPRDFAEMTKAIGKLPQVTELKLVIDEDMLQSVKTSIVPTQPNLKILLFLDGQFRRSQQAKFGAGKTIYIEYDDDDEEFMLQAREIFKQNRELVSKSQEFRPLQYVGFHTYIYTCSPFPYSTTPKRGRNVFSIERRGPGGEYEIDLYQVTQLSASERIMFYDIRQKVFLPNVLSPDID